MTRFASKNAAELLKSTIHQNSETLADIVHLVL
jgi:hypothetical protein